MHVHDAYITSVHYDIELLYCVVEFRVTGTRESVPPTSTDGQSVGQALN